jgi:hypothetical protein
MKPSFYISMAFVAAAAPFVNASVTIAYNNTALFDDSDVKNLTAAQTSNHLFLRRETNASDGFREALQSFTVDSSITVQAVNILINRAIQGKSITISLIEWDNTTGRPGSVSISQTQWDAATVLRTESITFGSEAAAFGSQGSFDDALSTLTWTLPSSITLSPLSGDSNNYGIVIQPTDATNADSVLNWRFADGDLYTDIANPNSRIGYYKNANSGGLFRSDQFGTNVEADLAFGLVAVPEPSTYALLLGVAALGGVLLRRRLRG